MMNIETQLEFEMNFTDSEKLIAHYILEHGKEVLELSIQDLAKRTYTSPATIVRLTRKLGLDGYNDFKIKYSAELENRLNDEDDIDVNFPFIEADSYDIIAKKLARMSAQSIDHTAKLINQEDLNQAVKMMKKAEIIDLYGSDNSLLVAESFVSQMTRIGKNVSVRSRDGAQVFLASASSPSHLAIIISYSGETESILRYAKILREKKTPTIVITSVGDNHLSHYGDVVLHLDSREKIFNKIAPFASFLSMNYILNLLYSCYFKENYHDNIDMKVQFDKESDFRHPLMSPINDEAN